MKSLLLLAILPVTVAAQCTGSPLDRQLEGLLATQDRRIPLQASDETLDDATAEAPPVVVPTAAEVIVACPFVDGEDVFDLLAALSQQRTDGVSAESAKANLLQAEFDCDNGNDAACIECVDTMIAFAFPGTATSQQPDPTTERPVGPSEFPANVALACIAVNQEKVPGLLEGIFNARDDGVGRAETLQFLSFACGADAGCQSCISEMVDVVFGDPTLEREALPNAAHN